MPWDPGNLSLEKVELIKPQDKITNADLDVSLSIWGSNFSEKMIGVFVLHPGQASTPEDLHKKANVIPCNWIKLYKGDWSATLEICPRQKTVGKYDLILWWADPPSYVFDKDGNKVEHVPTNDTCFLPNAIEIVDSGLMLSPEKEKAQAEADQLKHLRENA